MARVIGRLSAAGQQDDNATQIRLATAPCTELQPLAQATLPLAMTADDQLLQDCTQLCRTQREHNSTRGNPSR